MASHGYSAEPSLRDSISSNIRTVDGANLELESGIDRRGEMPDVISGNSRLSISVGHNMAGITDI